MKYERELSWHGVLSAFLRLPPYRIETAQVYPGSSNTFPALWFINLISDDRALFRLVWQMLLTISRAVRKCGFETRAASDGVFHHCNCRVVSVFLIFRNCYTLLCTFTDLPTVVTRDPSPPPEKGRSSARYSLKIREQVLDIPSILAGYTIQG